MWSVYTVLGTERGPFPHSQIDIASLASLLAAKGKLV